MKVEVVNVSSCGTNVLNRLTGGWVREIKCETKVDCKWSMVVSKHAHNIRNISANKAFSTLLKFIDFYQSKISIHGNKFWRKIEKLKNVMWFLMAKLNCLCINLLWWTREQPCFASGFPLGLEKWEGIFQSGNFEQTGKVGENHTKYWKTRGIWNKYYLIFLMIFKWTVYYLIKWIKFSV